MVSKRVVFLLVVFGLFAAAFLFHDLVHIIAATDSQEAVQYVRNAFQWTRDDQKGMLFI